MATFLFPPIMKSLWIDSSEQYLYAAVGSNILEVIRLLASTGGIVDAQQ